MTLEACNNCGAFVFHIEERPIILINDTKQRKFVDCSICGVTAGKLEKEK